MQTRSTANRLLSSRRVTGMRVRVQRERVLVVGGGAAGFFAAIACAERAPGAQVTLLEKSSQFLGKVRISGGGRCNVTHHLFDPREFSTRYPRGGRALIGAFQRFQARDTVAWFEQRGVTLKTEADGRMFPVTDSSETIVRCLTETARAAGVELRANCGVEQLERAEPGFNARLSTGEMLNARAVLLATGGARTAALAALATTLGHSIEAPVPSLFTFTIDAPWLRALAGIAVPCEVAVAGTKLRETGPLLITHAGVSGPAVLRLSAWGARQLHDSGYRFALRVNWLPQFTEERLLAEFQARRHSAGPRTVANSPMPPLSARLWAALVEQSGVSSTVRWAELSREQQRALARQLLQSDFQVIGKSLNKDEFVTCGGIPLKEVDFKTMQSRVCPGLYFAGELLDIDGITGGFNFQAAWTTGWIAGNAMADAIVALR